MTGVQTCALPIFPLSKKPETIVNRKDKLTTNVPGGKENILLVEDEEMLRSLITSLLESKGYTVLTANDGSDGERLFKNYFKEIDLVISDLGLPKFGGDELFRRMKSLNPEVRMIITSGYIDHGTKDQLYSDGVKEIIHKPYELDEILTAIRKVLDNA